MHDVLFRITIDYTERSQDFKLHKKIFDTDFLAHINEKNAL